MGLDDMNQTPPVDENEIMQLQQQGWDIETTTADEAQRAEIENGLMNAGMEFQSYSNPDGLTYTVLRKAPMEEAYPAEPEQAAFPGEESYDTISDEERKKLESVYPDMFEDENRNAA